MVPWFHGTLVLCCHSRMVPWYHGIIVLCYHGSILARYQGVIAIWYRRTMVRWHHSTMEPGYLCTTVPWFHGIMIPWYHGIWYDSAQDVVPPADKKPFPPALSALRKQYIFLSPPGLDDPRWLGNCKKSYFSENRDLIYGGLDERNHLICMIWPGELKKRLPRAKKIPNKDPTS